MSGPFFLVSKVGTPNDDLENCTIVNFANVTWIEPREGGGSFIWAGGRPIEVTDAIADLWDLLG